MKPPPLLMGAALLFWGWQAGLLLPGIALALGLESARFIKARWEFSDADLTRIWTFCSVLFLAGIVYAFAANDGMNNFAGLLKDVSINSQRRAGETGSRTAAAMIRWLPMILFLFVSVQTFNARTSMPLANISLIYRRRLKTAQGRAETPPAMSTGQVQYSYFALCLCAASANTTQYATFFTGFGALTVWALWPFRSRRFSPMVWAGVLSGVLVLGYAGQHGIIRMQRLLNNYNPQWFSRFSQRGFDPERTRTALGQIGELKTSGRIVIRLNTEGGQAPPALLHEASYREYHSLSWVAGDAGGGFEYLASGSDGTSWDLMPGLTNVGRVSIACGIPNQRALLPLPRGTSRLEDLPDYVILSQNNNGAVLAEQVGLVIFDAHYGGGQSLDAPFHTNSDLAIPDREIPALDQVIAEYGLGRGEREETLRALGGFFANHFGYSLWQHSTRPQGTNDTPLARFLLETRSGHCEYFATATVLLLRQLNIPARYAVGYAVHEGSGGSYVVRQRDAHAWCLVWNEETDTWEDFDTTPASWIAEEAKRASMFQWLSDGWSRIKFEIAKLRWGEINVRRYLLWALIPVLLFLLYQIIFRRRKLQRGKMRSGVAESEAWPGLNSEFYHLESKLEEIGLVRRPGETATLWFERITRSGAAFDCRDALRALLRLHYRLRFDPRGLSDEDRSALRRQVHTCIATLGGASAPSPGNN